MKFIARCEDGAGKRHNDKQDRESCFDTLIAVKRSPEEDSQNRVFGDVSQFSYHGLNRINRGPGNVRIEPAQKRNDNA